jgi:hypothetical protein
MATNPLVAAADSLAASIKERQTMLAFNVFGTKEIVVYVIVIVIVLILIGWYVMRGRSRA